MLWEIVMVVSLNIGKCFGVIVVRKEGLYGILLIKD